MAQFHVSLIPSLDQLKKIGPEWNDLLRNSQADTVFLSWELQYAWAEAFLAKGNQLFVLAVFQENKLVGLAPWYIKTSKEFGLPVKHICSIGTPEAAFDYLDVMMRRGKEKEVTGVIYKYLLTDAKKSWDILMLSGIPSDSKFLLHFLERVEKDGKYVEISYGSYCPITILPTTRDEFLLGVSPNRRQQYKRHRRLLEKEGEIRLHSNSEPILGDIDGFFSLYDQATNFSGRNAKLVIEKLLGNAHLGEIIQIDSLYVGQQKIAALLHLKHEQTLSMYLMAVDKECFPAISIGTIVVGMCIENGIDRGYHVYDFLKGTENYKFHWANSSRTSLTLCFYQRRAVSVLVCSIQRIKNLGKIILR